MATSNTVPLQDVVEDELTCTVCLNGFNQSDRMPKHLPCPHSHTFCLECIQILARRNPFNCPLCMAEVQLAITEVEQLPNNLTVIALLDMSDRQVTSIMQADTVSVSCVM